MSSRTTVPLHVVQAEGADASLIEVIHGRAEYFASLVLEHGGILFRGFRVREAADHQKAIDALRAKPMDYTYRSTPRTQVHGAVFTATEYPHDLEIPLHCENAYQLTWPLWLSFCCIKPAATGGETPIAHMRKVTAAIPPATLDRFTQRGVKYIRHYRPHVDLSWESVFRTGDRAKVASFCAENRIHHEWLDAETLRTEQVCQGVAAHPVTGATVFFNQAHLFHMSSLGPLAAAEMIDVFGRDRVPRHARFGDGSDIGAEDLDAVRAAFASAAVDWQWQQGDVVVLDNMQVAHGRRAYTGERRVLAALLNPHRAHCNGG
jgi:alpha-ketoglutarate-dependent taurine dioxygenase